MNRLLYILALTLALTLPHITAQAAGNWVNGDDGYRFAYDEEKCTATHDEQDPLGVTGVHFFLHGSGGDALSYSPSSLLENGDTEPLFQGILANCGVIVVPVAPPTRFSTWDYTGYHTNGSEIARIIRLLTLADNIFPTVPITLTGGAEGGTMAFSVASYLNRIGRYGLIQKLTVINGKSPFTERVDGLLSAFDGIGPLVCTQPNNESSLDGSYEDNEECAYIMLGLPNKSASFHIDTLLVYGDEIYEHFSNTVVNYSSIGPNVGNSTYSVGSSDKAIGSDGWADVDAFILN